jgi:hypothetical protein
MSYLSNSVTDQYYTQLIQAWLEAKVTCRDRNRLPVLHIDLFSSHAPLTRDFLLRISALRRLDLNFVGVDWLKCNSQTTPAALSFMLQYF